MAEEDEEKSGVDGTAHTNLREDANAHARERELHLAAPDLFTSARVQQPALHHLHTHRLETTQIRTCIVFLDHVQNLHLHAERARLL
eukprot:COSAG05_NODE_1081_length_5940_cov_4.264852_11_plen_87_part_00